MKRHMGSTAAIVIGVLFFLNGSMNAAKHPQLGTGMWVAGCAAILGALAYRSAKKRKHGQVKESGLRKGLELAAIALLVLIALMYRDPVNRILIDPFPNAVVPLWALIAYICMAVKKKKITEPMDDLAPAPVGDVPKDK